MENKINEQKSNIVIFTRTRLGIPPPVEIDGKFVPYISCIKYLGIHVNSKLTRKNLANYLRRKAFHRIHDFFSLLFRDASTSWSYRV